MRLLLPLALAGALCAADGIKPRPQPSDYPVERTGAGLTVGAALLPPAEVRSTFVSDLNRGYTVVEVAFYPANGQTVEVDPADFLLRVVGTKKTYRPVRPKAIAGVLQKTAPNERTIDVVPTVGVGYETGGYDPWTGRRGGGWTTSTGVGVGVGSTRPASTDADRRTMETELSDKSLPEGATEKAVAGYIYFPVAPKKKKPVAYELEYRNLVVPLNK